MANNPTAKTGPDAEVVRRTADTTSKGGARQTWMPPYYDGSNKTVVASGRKRVEGDRVTVVTPSDAPPEPDLTGTRVRPARYDGPRAPDES